MGLDNQSRSEAAAGNTGSDIEACLAGKAYIAVLKHRLTNAASDRTFREIFDEAYRTASRGTKGIPSMSALSSSDPSSGSLSETIEPFLAGKAYIAVLKHHLAHGDAGRSARAVFEDAYRAAADMARASRSEPLGISRPK